MVATAKGLVLHIGCFKTGTTSIQRWLATDEIFRHDDIRFYPVLSFARSRRHLGSTWLAALALPNDSFLKKLHNCNSKEQQLAMAQVRLRRAQREALKNKDRIAIISNEHLFLLGKAGISRLRHVLEGLYGDHSHFTIVAYVRRQDKLLQSMYSTILKDGSTLSREEFLKGRHFIHRLAFYDRTLSAWREEFPRSKLIVRSFERGKLQNRDVVCDFAHLIDLVPKQLWSSGTELNPELREVQLEVLRGFNLRVDKFGDAPSRYAHKAFVQALEYQTNLSGKLKSEGVPRLLHKYSASNQRLSAQFFGGDPPFDESDLPVLSAEPSHNYQCQMADEESPLRAALSASSVALRRIATDRLEDRRRAQVLKILLLLQTDVKKAQTNIRRLNEQQRSNATDFMTRLRATAENCGIELNGEQLSLVESALSQEPQDA